MFDVIPWRISHGIYDFFNPGRIAEAMHARILERIQCETSGETHRMPRRIMEHSYFGKTSERISHKVFQKKFTLRHKIQRSDEPVSIIFSSSDPSSGWLCFYLKRRIIMKLLNISGQDIQNDRIKANLECGAGCHTTNTWVQIGRKSLPGNQVSE